MAIPGIPPLLRIPGQFSGAANILNNTVLLAADAIEVLRRLGPPKWGIFTGNVQVIVPDSVVSVEYRQDTRIADHPLEDGDFETYNKVGTPWEARVRMTKGGTDTDRAAFLKTAEGLVGSFDLYDVVTPERTYKNANVQRIDYTRSASNGMGLISIDFFIIEIRAFAKSQLAATKTPAGATQASAGRVQPQTPTKAVTNFVGRVPPPVVTNFVGIIPPSH